MAADDVLSTGQVGVAIGVPSWKIARLVAAKIIRPSQVIGKLRLFKVSQLDAIAAAVRERWPEPAAV